MSTIATKLQPLQHESYETLKTFAKDIDKQMIGALKRLDNFRRLKYLLEAEREGRMKMQIGDEENAYILYNRATVIYRMISDSADDVFKRSGDGRLFYETSNRLFRELEEVAGSLQQRFKHRQKIDCVTTFGVGKPFSDESVVNASLASLHDGVKFKKYAKPAEIVRFVANGLSALVLDYREDQSESIEYKSSHGTVKVVHINRRDIMPGSLLHSLFKALDISFRPLLENISHYDLVALLGDINDITSEKGTKTTILMEALTTYNFKYKLKRPPVIMEGGFINWKNAYPYYVNETFDVPRFEKTFDEKFAMWIVESRMANELRIQYPSLTEFSRETVAVHEQKQMPNKPIIDRSKKPTPIWEEPPPMLTLREKPTPMIRNDPTPMPREKRTPMIRDDPTPMPREKPTPMIRNDPTPMPREKPIPIIMEKPFPVVPPRPSQQQQSQRQQQTQISDNETRNYFLNAYAMSLQRIGNESEWKRTPPGQTGLFNMGNTCFMNATLQPLFHTPGFSQLFQEKNAMQYVNENNKFGTKGIISGCFSALIDLMWSGKFSAIRPHVFLEFFARRVNAELANRQQHDAHEFQIYLLDALHEDTNKVDTRKPFEQNYDNTDLRASASDFFERSKLFSSSPVNDIFNLTTISVIQCKTCSSTSVRFEDLNQISVELPTTNDCLKLKDCLKAHFSSSDLEAPWECPKCKSKQPATQSTKLWKVPKVLIIHLKRFSRYGGNYVKNEVELTSDVDGLDLLPYIHEKSPLRNAAFSLYGITNHSGRLNSGHYTSKVVNLASDDRQWLSFDDESCVPCFPPSPTSKQAFLLYYKLWSSQTT